MLAIRLPLAPLLALYLFAGASVAQQTSGHDWPHIRGPELDGTAMGGGIFDGETVGFRERWRVAVGSGYSGASIAEGRVVTSVSDGATDAIWAFSEADGSPLWKYTIGPIYRGHDGSADGLIGSPVIGRGKVFVVGPRGKLFALGFDDGELKWSVDLITDLGAEPPIYGVATTPLLEDDMLIVQVGAVKGRALCGFDPDSGKLVWSVGDGFQYEERCQSPIVMNLGGHRQVVAMNGHEILGVAPADGTILWRHTLWQNANASRGFVCPMGDDRFCAIFNGQVAGFRVSHQDSYWSVETLFRSRDLGGTSWAAPVYFEGNLYGFRSNILACVDAASGKRLWRSRPPGGKGLILVDDRLVVFAAQGVIAVAEATPDGYNEQLRGQFLQHSSFTWPSFANGHIFVRNTSELVCIQVVQADTAVAVADAPQPVEQGAFGRFVQSLTRAEDKTALLDAFFAEQESFPIVEDNTVHVVYRGDVEDVAIAGAMLDDARPRALQRVEGTNFYYRSYPIEAGARWEYGLQVDFGEPTPDPLNPRTAFGIIYNDIGNPRYEGPLSEVVMPGYDSATHLREPEGARGRIETYEFESVALGNKRSIKVYLPVGYGDGDDDGETKYPLLIVHRGPEWLEKGKMTHSLDNLIGTRVQPVVVAFVPPGPIWWSEGAGTGTDKYLAMLVEEFVPDLERRYRLSSRPQDRALIGANWFGLTAAYGVILFPDVFGKAGVQSAGLGEISVHDFFERLHSRPANDAVFYVDWNRYEMRVPDQSWDQRADGLRLSSELRKQGYKVAGGEALDTHGWTSWRARTDDLLVALFPLE